MRLLRYRNRDPRLAVRTVDLHDNAVQRRKHKPVTHGLIAGVWLAVPTAASLRESVRGSTIRIDNGEPLLYCAAALLLAGAATLAMLGPARRGASTNPLDALRSD